MRTYTAMRTRSLAAAAAAVTLVGAVGTALTVGGDDGDRSACGRVGDRERAVSPDGGRVAFVRCTPAGSAWLYVADPGGGRERRVVPRRFNCCYRPSERVVFRDPDWSRDARFLAVVIEDVGGTDVWALAADGSSARRVTTGPARERGPKWSRDGRSISYRTETGALAFARVARRPAGS